MTTLRDNQKILRLKERGEVIIMRECVWNRAKPSVLTSPYSAFYYATKITERMILESVKNERLFGLIEVDLKCPEELKRECEAVNFPIIFNKITPTKEMLSEQMQERCKLYGTKFPLKPQLTLVYEATNYLLTTNMLKFYLDLGVYVGKIHYCIEYQRSQPLKPFIEHSMNHLLCQV